MASSPSQPEAAAFPLQRSYSLARSLKYGINPHQSPAALLANQEFPLPLKILHGSPGFVNLLDALNSFQLVKELATATGRVAAASFKHCSPAGAAVAAPLSPLLSEVFEAPQEALSEGALAYLRARQADPKSSFGDFAAISCVVDVSAAKILCREFSDGVIAPGFAEGALSLLRQKKGGNFLVLQMPIEFEPPPFEYRELFGICLVQRRNDFLFTSEFLRRQAGEAVENSKILDMLVATITCKYTQSNSVVCALDGQVIGVGAGQQSRVDCVRLAGQKAVEYFLRQHPRIRKLKFKQHVKRTERVNTRIALIQGDLSPAERALVEAAVEGEDSSELSTKEKADFLQGFHGVSMSSDGFFPFRDSIDQAAKRGVGFIVQPGGSVADGEVSEAARSQGICLVNTGIRLFHH